MRAAHLSCPRMNHLPSSNDQPARPLRVLSIAHSAISAGSSRLRYHPLAESTDIDLTLVVPDRWHEYGRRLRLDPADPALPIRIAHIRLPTVWKAKWYLHYYPELNKLLTQFAPHVLHLWEEPWSIVALQAALMLKRRFQDTALIVETDQNILYRLPFPFERIRRYTLEKTDTLIVRQEEALSVSKACGYRGPAVTVEYCVDRSRFHPEDREQCRNHFGIQGFTLGYVGRLIEEKGLFTILEAAHKCEEEVYLLIAGEGPAENRLRAKSLELGLEKYVRFLGAQSQAVVARLFNAVDALCLMSRTTHSWKEQFGRVIMEAQACGTPVIGSTSGAIPDVVGDGGWIVEEGNATMLAQLLNRLVRNPALRTIASAQALRNSDRFSPEVVSTALSNAYFSAEKYHRLRKRT